jgi:hypothetical protein
VCLEFGFVVTHILAIVMAKFIAFKACDCSYKLVVISFGQAIIVKCSIMIDFKVNNLVAFTFKLVASFVLYIKMVGCHS